MWLAENVSGAEALKLATEVEEALRRIQALPGIGPAVTNARTRGARRLHLRTKAYHLYYRVNERRGFLEVLALRHTRRGRGAGV